LEIGCGQGFGIELLLRDFGAATVHGIDLDPAMVARARARVESFSARARVSVGDAAAIDAPDGSYDAVADFGVVHHVPAWQDAVREVRRVLRPGGIFLFEEVSRQALDRWIYRTLFDHPKDDRFTIGQFTAALETNGIALCRPVTTFCFGDFFAGAGQVH
jgi:SAM-dependent methyltransferase